MPCETKNNEYHGVEPNKHTFGSHGLLNRKDQRKLHSKLPYGLLCAPTTRRARDREAAHSIRPKHRQRQRQIRSHGLHSTKHRDTFLTKWQQPKPVEQPPEPDVVPEQNLPHPCRYQLLHGIFVFTGSVGTCVLCCVALLFLALCSVRFGSIEIVLRAPFSDSFNAFVFLKSFRRVVGLFTEHPHHKGDMNSSAADGNRCRRSFGISLPFPNP